jgi:hypothetical protein
VLGRPIDQVDCPRRPPADPLAAAAPPTALQARRPLYGVAEIAHFGFCPFRYKLETLDRGARTYRDANDAFQLGPLAQSFWLDPACRHLEGTGRAESSEDAIRNMLYGALGATRAAA